MKTKDTFTDVIVNSVHSNQFLSQLPGAMATWLIVVGLLHNYCIAHCATEPIGSIKYSITRLLVLHCSRCMWWSKVTVLTRIQLWAFQSLRWCYTLSFTNSLPLSIMFGKRIPNGHVERQRDTNLFAMRASCLHLALRPVCSWQSVCSSLLTLL